MLKQFKAKQSKGYKKTLVPKKKKTIPDEKEVSESSDDNVSDSEDSEYEELLIGDIINKTKIEDKKEDKKLDVKPEVKPEVKEEELLPPPLKLERQQTKPIDIPKPKKKSKKIVIKKYYNYKPKTTSQPAPVSQPIKEIQLNYLGLPMTGGNTNTTTRNHMTSKIFNW